MLFNKLILSIITKNLYHRAQYQYNLNHSVNFDPARTGLVDRELPDTNFNKMLEEGHWDIVTASLQDICNSNESTTFDNIYLKYSTSLPKDKSELESLLQQVTDHKSNIETAKRLVETCQENLDNLVANVQKSNTMSTRGRASKSEFKSSSETGKGLVKKQKRVGRLFHTSKFNPSEPVIVGSDVAYKLRNRHTDEWIQCEVTKIIGDGIKFEVRDPEPDENNNPGQTFKANYKEIILIVSESGVPQPVKSLPSYPYGLNVLARYPETTTFYPAVVVGTKKDGTVRLKFDGEEEANKETEVERRLVLPLPEK